MRVPRASGSGSRHPVVRTCRDARGPVGHTERMGAAGATCAPPEFEGVPPRVDGAICGQVVVDDMPG